MADFSAQIAERNRIDIDEFIAADALGRVRLIDRAHGRGALQLASMQKTSGVIMHLIHRAGASTRILFVDTQYHFPETLELRDEFAARYGLTIETVAPKQTPAEQIATYGVELYKTVDGQPICCNLRKEEPYLLAARGIEASISGLMRAEGGKRKNIPPISFDPRLNCLTIAPIFDWNRDKIEEYTREHDLPVHKLYALSYPSIGCAPCTTPVAPGEEERAGRWRHLRTDSGSQPQYCNINFSDGGGI